MKRDEFSKTVREHIAKQVAFHCSNPICRTSTLSADEDGKPISIGVAAHITAAAPKGPRRDDVSNSEDRKSSENGIWLCQTCSRLIDVDPERFTVEILKSWKSFAIAAARVEMDGYSIAKSNSFLELEEIAPDLIEEMREDLTDNPFVREFILMDSRWSYNGDPNHQIFQYFFDRHPNLKNKIKILQNHNAVFETTYNNTDRFEFTEPFVKFLTADQNS